MEFIYDNYYHRYKIILKEEETGEFCISYDENSCNLHSFCIYEKFRGLKLSKLFLNELVSYLTNNGIFKNVSGGKPRICSIITLSCTDDNIIANTLYNSFGFKKIGTYKTYNSKGNLYEFKF